MARMRHSVKQAEARAYAGQNESQDSQIIMDLYHREHGVSTLSSSPAPEERLQLSSIGPREAPQTQGSNLNTHSGRAAAAKVPSKSPHDALMSKTRIAAVQTSTTTTPQAANANSSALGSSLTSESDGKNVPLPASRHGSAVFYEVPILPIKGHVRRQAPRSAAPLVRRKMEELMSESPTQSNEGRSYEQYLESRARAVVSSQIGRDQDQDTLPIDQDSQLSRISSSHEHRTLHEDESGAVKFDWRPPEEYEDEDNEATTDPVISTSQPTTKSQPSVNASALSSRHSMPASTMPPPETPVVAQRLFQADVPPSNIMGASQLFMQTQFTSGVKKLASPTSSRPSPHMYEHNTISPNNTSSPLGMKDRGLRTSPTQGPTTSPVCSAPNTTSKSDPRNQELETIPGSPNADIEHSRLRNRPEPIGDYAPIRNSPAYENGATMEEDGVESDSDCDEFQERRRLAKLKQERAHRSLININFPRQNIKEDVEVPSTNLRKQSTTQSTASVLSSPQGYIEQLHRKPDVIVNGESQETVADSQEAIIKPNAVVDLVLPDSSEIENAAKGLAATQPELPFGPNRSSETTGSKETIPETSPPRDGLPQRSAKSFPEGPLLNQRQRRSSGRIAPFEQPNSIETKTNRSSGRLAKSNRPSSEETTALPSSPPVPVLVTASSQVSRRSSRLKVAVTPVLPSSDLTHGQQHESLTTSSTLSVLSETPNVSSSTTPNTESADLDAVQNAISSPAAGTGVVSSPAAAKNLRQNPPKLKTYSSPGTRGSARSIKTNRQSSVSTDELALSTPVSALDRSSRSFARKSLQEIRQSASSAGIFHGMTFATSFKSDQEKRSVEKMIIGAGGTIIPRGFEELVDVGPLEADTKPGLRNGRSAGFAALITDTHSRKQKYMQALALGLPCLSWKWVSNCVRANAIIDWSTYLLCAGQSQVLGAIRSRSLDSYDASAANVGAIIEKRQMLLGDGKVLLVMKKSKKEEEKRMPYVFLAQVLGASIVRVSNLEEARAELLKKEETNNSFDWVYVNGHPAAAEKVLFGQDQTAPPKKRKRQSTVDTLEEVPPKRVRTLTDELVVQSLILGRLVEDGEMEDALP